MYEFNTNSQWTEEFTTEQFGYMIEKYVDRTMPTLTDDSIYAVCKHCTYIRK